MKFAPNEWVAHQLYGGVPESWKTTPDGRYPKALMAIVGADGISDAERRAFLQEGAAIGAPSELMSELLEGFEPQKQNLEALVKNLSHDQAAGRRLLYDAIRIAHVDGYSSAERAAAKKVSGLLGVDAMTLAVIEGLVESENALRHIRASLFTGK